MKRTVINNVLTIGIALVWLINGLFCKLLNLIPRHELIVSRILGADIAPVAVKIIGVLEILMFCWIISRIKPRLCALIQVLIIAAMNIIEFILAPDLLLFGKVNIIFAALFIVIILINEMLVQRNKKRKLSNN